MSKFKIFDATLRDGGYYTDWDFDSKTVDAYVKAMNALPIDYLELGYRNNPTKEYMGKYGYCPVSALKHIRATCTKKLDVMLNEKSTKPEDLEVLIKPLVGIVDMIRVAIDPKNFDRAVILAKAIKAMGFELGFNCMYMSRWLSDYPDFLKKLNQINGVADLFCMVDSFGGMTPQELTTIVKEVKANTTVPVGFHGHNNLQLGLINTLTAIDLGLDYVDCTVLGMGRGAGNLNTELLLTYLNAQHGLEVDFNVLGDVITAFTPLYEKYRWGTQLPYMISGANSIPQKEVMELVTNRIYSFDSIVRGLQNRKDKVQDNAKYPILNEQKFEDVIIIGGGQSPLEHKEAITEFIKQKKSVALVFATARHAAEYQDLDVPKYFCLVGREAKRLVEKAKLPFTDKCVLPPYPRKLGTDVPDFAIDKTFELADIKFTKHYYDSCTTVAIETAINLSSKNVYIVGYDGYPSTILSEKEMALTIENRTLFADYHAFSGQKLISLTRSLYDELDVVSIYQYI